MATLKERYGAELDAPEFHNAPEVPLARRIARQFAFIHLHVKDEKQQAPPSAEG